MGGVVGGLLASVGKDVVLVARNAQLEALRTRGLEVTTASGTVRVEPPVAAGPQDVELRADDVLVLAVKSQDTPAALGDWADRPVAGGGTAAERLPVVCAQNGVDNEREALRRFASVVAMCVWLPATYLEPGRVSAGGTPVPGVLTVGPAAPVADPDLVTAYARDLVGAGFDAPVTADVMQWKYRKLLSNLGNAVEALCGTTRNDAVAELSARAEAEGRAVLSAAGVAVLDEAVHDAARAGFRMTRLPGQERTGGSSWQSLVRGTGSIEADHLNGEIVLLGRLHGVATPVNAVLQRHARQAARTGATPGSTTAGALLSETSV
ncbi:2-dehydropantoate 2-reductase [Cellulomonas xylanilytica]|uniref:2-dehydropantoate 2-reductase n=1 Tax=Cellulomonas xylanilytica TaxID=233583 RepID=A0A510V0Z1_9CELL|nr:2-dehydropantoate 2-reductase [Cellulomonas xylanilytica]